MDEPIKPGAAPLKKVKLSIHHRDDDWVFAAAAGPWPRYDSAPGFRTVSEATQAALEWAKVNQVAIEVTGHADREILRAAGVRYIDSRGNDRRGAGSKAKQRAIMDAQMAARRASAQTAPPPAPPPPRTPAQLAALAAARAKRATARERKPPEGYRSLEHFLDTAREFVGRRSGATLELSRYLRVNESSVRRWLKREKLPLQDTIDAIDRWMRMEK